jgi:CheY-like chemotaxis protein
MRTDTANQYDTSKRPILLVDDNFMDVDLTIQACIEHGVPNRVEVCRDGEEALDYIAAHSSAADPSLPALVLLDLRMPKVSGFEVLDAARAHAVWKRVPIIVMTTSRDQSDIGAAYDAGVNSYLVKPVDSTDFANLMETIKAYWLQTNQPPFYPPVGRMQ